MTLELESLDDLILDRTVGLDRDTLIWWLKRAVSGTYRNSDEYGSILELRVDVDGRRPQDRLSGDLYTRFTFCGLTLTLYTGSFIVDDVTKSHDNEAMDLSGPVRYYSDPTNNADSIAVHIPRVGWQSKPAAACVEWYENGKLVRSYLCYKTSEYFRKATLEIDRFQGTDFPPQLDPDLDPAPDGLPDTVSIESVFKRSGIDLTVVHDDVLDDPDGDDPGNNWSEAELHDLMETRFDSFANRLQWNLYGVIVPRFGDPSYDSGYYGTMFDFGGWQAGDSFLRQGFAIAEDAIRGRGGSLYNTEDEKDRLTLQTLIHEAGHAFNLPHTWQRSDNPDAGSESFMNYPWGYMDNGGGESSFWANFRWEFDDVEVIWMRHADRNDVIFGGRDWVWNNLSADLNPAFEGAVPAKLTIDSDQIFDIGVPVTLELHLENTSQMPIEVVDRLQPEDGLIKAVIRRPDGDIVPFAPPVRRLKAPPDLIELGPGETVRASIGLSYGAQGQQFDQPGSYLITIFYPCWPIGFVATATRRIRVANPTGRAGERLAHLLTSREAAQFLYFGGIQSVPEVEDELVAAAEEYAETDPVPVRHITAALAKKAGRRHKYIAEKAGRNVVVSKPADPDKATRYLREALAPLPEDYRLKSAFTPMAEADLVSQYADLTAEAGEKEIATEALDDTVKRLEDAGLDYAAGALKRQSRNLKRRKT